MLPALARAFTSLLFGLSHLEEKDSERSGTDNIEGAVVYSYVTAFGNILDAATLCCLARSCLDFEVTDEEKANIPKRKKDASKARLTQQVVEAPKLISNLLLAVVSQLSPTQRTHRKLFEGYLYVILSRVAECLNIVHFGRERSNVQIRVTAPEGRVCSAAEEERGIAYEGVVLGKLLERTNSLAPSFLSQVDIGTAPDKRKPGRRKTAQNMAVSKPSGAKSSTKVLDKLTLPSLVRERLQRTLVDCMFGQIDDHFLECLTMPPRKSLKEPPRSKEEKVKMQEDPKGWFFDKVWDLVGWEILEKEDD